MKVAKILTGWPHLKMGGLFVILTEEGRLILWAINIRFARFHGKRAVTLLREKECIKFMYKYFSLFCLCLAENKLHLSNVNIRRQ